MAPLLDENRTQMPLNAYGTSKHAVKEVIAKCKAAPGHDVSRSFGPRRTGGAAAYRWYQTGGYSG
jgi:hypothetical protein